MKNQNYGKLLFSLIFILIGMQFVIAECTSTLWLQVGETLSKDGHEIRIIAEDHESDHCNLQVDGIDYDIAIDDKEIFEDISITILDVKCVYSPNDIVEIYNECMLNFYKFEDLQEIDFDPTQNNHTYGNNVISLIDVMDNSCEFEIDGNEVEVPDHEFIFYNGIGLKSDPYQDECELELFTRLDSLGVKLTTDNLNTEFDGKSIEMTGVTSDYDACQISIDSVSIWTDIGDYEIIDDIMINSLEADGYTNEIFISHDLDLCKLEIRDCECDEEIECSSFNCEDDDEQDNIYYRGTIESDEGEYKDECYRLMNGNYVISPSCEDDCYVGENYCISEGVEISYQECLFGCDSGECNRKTYTDEIDLNNFPGLFIDNGFFEGLLVVGKEAPAYDTLAIVNIALGIQKETYISQVVCSSDPNGGCTTTHVFNPIPSSVNKFDQDATLNSNIISVGNPCDNEITAEIVGSSECDYMVDDGQEAVIFLKEYGNFIHMAVYGSDSESTVDLSKILQNYEDNSLYGTKYYLNDKYHEEEPEEEPEGEPEEVPEEVPEEEPEEVLEEDECIDSDDGIDYFENGKIKNSQGDIIESDSCCTDLNDNECKQDFGEVLLEAYCDEFELVNVKHICIYGCKYGACLQEEETDEGIEEDNDDNSEEKEEVKDEDKNQDDELQEDIGDCLINEDCNDNNESTLDTCNINTGDCYYTQIDQCLVSLDCNDDNPCTTDVCLETSKKCSNEQTSGCNLDNVCVPIGTRSGNKFCSVKNELLTQNSNSGSCDNNYECVSNICVNSKCIKESFIQQIIDWFANFFG